MKTVIDAVNISKTIWQVNSDAMHFNGGFYYEVNDRNYATFICSKGEFNQCVDEMATNYGTSETYADYKANFKMINDDVKPVAPTYTQEMVDQNILPSVGMEYQDGVVLVGADADDMYVVQEAGVSIICALSGIEPLTPPIELIDGKAYQFKDVITCVGIFSSHDDCFHNPQGWTAVADCTDIKLLEVKA